MKCPRCSSSLKKVKVQIESAKQKAVSYQCTRCDYVEFEEKSALAVIEELKT